MEKETMWKVAIGKKQNKAAKRNKKSLVLFIGVPRRRAPVWSSHIAASLGECFTWNVRGIFFPTFLPSTTLFLENALFALESPLFVQNSRKVPLLYAVMKKSRV